jgi:alpha-beta hydrolase superfamily lysophospholipase
MNLVERSALWVSSHVVPWLSVNGKGLDIWPSDNVEMLRALGRDPLVIKDTKVGTLDGLVDLMDEAYVAAPLLQTPTLVLYGEHDEVVPPRPTYDVMATFSRQSDIMCSVYPKGYHMLLRDLHADVVLADIVAWINKPGGALPSGGDQLAVEAIAQHRPMPIAANEKSPG